MKKYNIELFLILVTVIIYVGAFYLLQSKINSPRKHKHHIELPPVKLVWGFPLDSITVDTFKVTPNQNLSDILFSKGISATSIDRLASNSKAIFDVRKIKSGNSYYIINKVPVSSPDFLIYEESAVDYIVYNLDSMNVYRGQKQIDTIQQTITGVIETSLWNSFVDNGCSPSLALELSNIFAWTIDFFGIQQGDQYRVFYDEFYVEEKFAGIGKVHATSFINMGDTIFAYYYKNNNQEGYFDDKGQSLRKAFLKAPLQFSRISSHFSHSRFHPVLKIRRPHKGVDYAAPTGTPVYSIGDGVVVQKAFQRNGGGNYLTIKHNSVYSSQYMHLHGFAKGMAPGVRVKQGDLIGYVGRTGLATGPHLDFRIYMNGAPVDPLKVKAPPVEPINESNMKDYLLQRDSLKTILLGIPIE